MKSLEELIEDTCESLPEGWAIQIYAEQGSGYVTVIRPDESEVHMSDGESDIREQYRNALCLVQDEIAADKMTNDCVPA